MKTISVPTGNPKRGLSLRGGPICGGGGVSSSSEFSPPEPHTSAKDPASQAAFGKSRWDSEATLPRINSRVLVWLVWGDDFEGSLNFSYTFVKVLTKILISMP